jgi:hypothetical protein
MSELPTLNAAEMAKVEEKLVNSGLAKLNTGLTPSKLEMDAINRAGQRGEAAEAPNEELATTELGLEIYVSESLEKRGIHDGSRLLERKRELFFVIARLLAMSTPIRDICSICRVSASTVQSVADHPEAKLPAVTQKEQFVSMLRLCANLGLGALVERFQRGEVTAVEWGIVVDKLALAEGGVTSRTEIIHSHEEDDEWTRLCREARATQQRDVTPAFTMVTDAEEVSPKAALAPLGLPQMRPESHARDIQSPVMHTQNVDSEQ